MDRERRTGKKPVPDNVEGMLNEMQLLALRRLEGFGWVLRFVRRPLFQDPVAVIFNPKGDLFATLEEDGSLNMKPDIKVRP